MSWVSPRVSWVDGTLEPWTGEIGARRGAAMSAKSYSGGFEARSLFSSVRVLQARVSERTDWATVEPVSQDSPVESSRLICRRTLRSSINTYRGILGPEDFKRNFTICNARARANRRNAR